MDRLDELSLLIAILDEGTLAAAAKKTGRSAAAVTRVLADFETRIGVRLVERTTRKLAPTDAGLRLADHARRLLSGYAESIEEATGDTVKLAGLLRISAPVLFGRHRIAPVVAQFLALHGQVNVELILSNQVVDLVENSIDVALRLGALKDSQLISRQIARVRHVIVASPHYLERHGVPTDLAMLNNHAVVLQSFNGEATEWRFQTPGAGWTTVHAQRRLVVNDVGTSIDMALAGTGLIRPLSYQVTQELADGRLVRVLQDFEPPARPVNMVYLRKKHMPLRVRAFIDFAKEALRNEKF